MKTTAACSDDEFIELFESVGATGTARHLDVDESNVYKRRRRLEVKLKRRIRARRPRGPYKEINAEEHPARLHLKLTDGVVLVGSDAHYWPGIISAAHRAFVQFCKKLKPEIVVMNGDIIDGSSISRFPPIGWEHRPSLIQEIEAASDRLDEIFKATPNAKHPWCLGNHDARFATRLATVAPEYAKVKGTQLKDHFPGFQPCWSVWLNDDVVVKHRFRGGIHAVYNNTLHSGKTVVTGHLHSLKVTPFSDYSGVRYGVDTGTLADPYGPQFEYQEDNPRNHRSGFAVLTFRNSRLMWPEVCQVLSETEVEFRGEILKV